VDHPVKMVVKEILKMTVTVIAMMIMRRRRKRRMQLTTWIRIF